jgi:hypothetical protein
MMTWIRPFHRWTSIVFTAIVAAIFATLGIGRQPAQWVYYLPLAPLFLLTLTGLYLFFRPYFKARQAKAGAPQP